MRALQLPVRAYRLALSPVLPARCRFLPTCSEYALEALEAHGPRRGGALALRRLARCRPGADWGYDPVPPARGARGDARGRPAPEDPFPTPFPADPTAAAALPPRPVAAPGSRRLP